MAEKNLILGLDVGNTVIKAVLFDTTGRQIAEHAIDGHSTYPQPGYVERDLEELWRNGCEAIRQLLVKSAVDPNSIAGVGCAGHGNGLYLLDKEQQPLLGIQSLDSRAADMAAELDRKSGDLLQARCLQRPWPAQTPTLLAWVKRHAPDLYAQTGTVLFCKDFVNFRLTGRLANDISDLSGAGLLALPEVLLDRELLSLYDVEDAFAFFPRFVESADIVGQVTREAAGLTGLSEGTPVIGGFFDVVSSAMGSGVINAGEASVIAGTWSINQVFADKPVVSPDVFMVTTFGRDRYVNVESSATSAANLEWYVHRVRADHGDHAFERCNELVGSVTPRADDPFFHPFIFGSRLGAEFRGGFYGLAGWHGEGHMVRALFEGVCFEHRRHIGVLREAGLPVESAVMSGGGSRSQHWPQIMADVLEIPLRVAEARETGALGAAIGAAVATGLYPNYEEAVAAMTRVQNSYQPDTARVSHYRQRYGLYQELTGQLRSFWSALRLPQ
ncbi:L-xylulose/3-keto-L-gulonate kinase [Agrobacterium fabrum]|uniref:FGGY-family carbohydrate kinase n=1 Tax=Agrobacterium fabrum TaxID=1176649 RepID=UPI001DE6EC92|nr:FGGY-family carbohydrate kinase [Agrobacterium fabrum]CAH0145443.1 L-xylulose/3-keto-L-gulonate kinase [Agrobacterium fabrum]CAH0192740.1 L-xylulose/3-keto-L-gulonate kinase [Agrobacterium fabrum]